MNTKFKLSVLAGALALCATNAFASGFQVNEHSASGLGRAFAGEGAIADNASVLARNPAAMMMFDKTTVSMAATMIDPDYSVDGEYFINGNKAPIPVSSASHSNAAPNAVVPAAYMIHPINEQWAVGLAMMTNYGLGTRFNDSFGADGGLSGVGGLMAGETSLMSVNLNPNVAYRINEQWSVGGGINYTIATAYVDRVNGNTNDHGSHDTLANFDGSGNGWGWNLGTMFEINQDHRLALTYRSQIDLDLEGDYTGSIGADGYMADATVDLPMPAIAEFSGYHRLSQQFAMHYSVMWTDWSQFEKLEANSAQCDINGHTGTCLTKNEQLEDSWRVALGGTWYINPAWEARAGVAYDQSAVQSQHATISLPDADKWWYSAGLTYHIDDLKSIDFGMAYIDGPESDVKEGVIHNAPDNPFYFEGTNEGNAFLASIQFNMKL